MTLNDENPTLTMPIFFFLNCQPLFLIADTAHILGILHVYHYLYISMFCSVVLRTYVHPNLVDQDPQTETYKVLMCHLVVDSILVVLYF